MWHKPHPGLLIQSPAPSEFERIARRTKKAFLSEKCKGIEEKNRIGKTRDLFKRIKDTKGTFHAKMGTIKDRNYLDLTEPEALVFPVVMYGCENGL